MNKKINFTLFTLLTLATLSTTPMQDDLEQELSFYATANQEAERFIDMISFFQVPHEQEHGLDTDYWEQKIYELCAEESSEQEEVTEPALSPDEMTIEEIPFSLNAILEKEKAEAGIVRIHIRHN